MTWMLDYYIVCAHNTSSQLVYCTVDTRVLLHILFHLKDWKKGKTIQYFIRKIGKKKFKKNRRNFVQHKCFFLFLNFNHCMIQHIYLRTLWGVPNHLLGTTEMLHLADY